MKKVPQYNPSFYPLGFVLRLLSFVAIFVFLAGVVPVLGDENSGPAAVDKKKAEEAWRKEQAERERILAEREKEIESRKQDEERWAREEEIRRREVAIREDELGRLMDADKDQIKRIVERKRIVREREDAFQEKIERLESQVRERAENKKKREENAERKVESLRSRIASAQEALEKTPNDSELYWLLGTYHLDLGLQDEAIRYFSRTIELSPGNFGAYYNMGLAYDQKNDGPQAVLNMKKAEQMLLVTTRSWEKERVKWVARSRKNLRRMSKKYKIAPDQFNLDGWLSQFSTELLWSAK